MGEFKLNEEQENLMSELSIAANKLIEKYSHMQEAFEIVVNKITTKMNHCEDESLEEVKKEVKELQRQTSYVREKLGKINYIANGHDGYTSATRLLDGVQSIISDAMYELGKLEGYSSGKIYTFSDICTLKSKYEALKKSLLE